MNLYFNGNKLAKDDDLQRSSGMYYRGGENLIKGSAFKSIDDMIAKGWSLNKTYTTVKDNSLILTGAKNNSSEITIQVPFIFDVIGYSYVLSFQLMFMKGMCSTFLVETKNNGKATSSPYTDHFRQIANSYNRANNVQVLKAASTETDSAVLHFRASAGAMLQFRLPKLELNTQPTVWTPSPADL